MIAPYAHLGDLDVAPKKTSDEMMDLAKRSQSALRDAYRPEGFNLGMNLGSVAGAGVADAGRPEAVTPAVADLSAMPFDAPGIERFGDERIIEKICVDAALPMRDTRHPMASCR